MRNLQGVEERLRALEVRFVDQKEIGGLDDPGLQSLDDVPRAGLEDENDQVGTAEDVELGLPDADRLDEDAVQAERVQDVGRVRCRRRKPAVAAPERPSSG